MPRARRADLDAITRRNKRALEMYRLGDSMAEITRVLTMSPKTVRRLVTEAGELLPAEIDVRVTSTSQACAIEGAKEAARPATESQRRGAQLGGQENRRRAADKTSHDPFASDVMYTVEQAEWLKACEAYGQKHSKRFMNKCDYLAVARELGYKK